MANTNSWLGLEGKKVIVTGGGSGIGRQVALAFAEAGALAAPMDLNTEGARETARLVGEVLGQPVPHYSANVADQDAVGEVFESVAKDWETLDILANVAGVLKAGNLEELSQKDWNLTLNVDLTGAFLVSQGAKRLMAGGGALVHVASVAGTQPQPFSGAYSPAKAGLRMLSRQLAFEWGPDGVRSNVVSPGLVRTPMSEAFYQAPGVLEARQNVVPVRRIADPEDMANVVLFLASERSSYVNGQDIVVDGGFSQSLMSLVPRPGFDD